MRSELEGWNWTPRARALERAKGGLQVAAGVGKAVIVVPLTFLNAIAGPYGYTDPHAVVTGRARDAAVRVREGARRIKTGQPTQR